MVRNVILFFLRKTEAISNYLHLFFISINPDIQLGKGININRNSRIDIVHSGRIVIGDFTEILHGALILTYGGDIKIGSNCSINSYCIIYGHGGVSIGNHVLIAAATMIIPSNHRFDDITKNIVEQGNKSKGITIEDDVWIGHGCSILDGVTIGKGSVIAAGSVVTKSIPSFTVAAGVPAKIIKIRK